MTLHPLRGRGWIGRSISLAVLLFYTAFALLSLYLMVVSSLSHLGVSFTLSDLHFVPRDWAWRNFADFFQLMHSSPVLWLRNTLVVRYSDAAESLFFCDGRLCAVQD